MRVAAYWNLHRHCWSLKALEGPDKGRVKYHASAFQLTDCQFRVSEAGRQRVLREKRKNVHAYVVGRLAGWVDLDGDQGQWGTDCPGEAEGVPVTYNPYRAPTFESADLLRTPMQAAPRVVAVGRRVVACHGEAVQ